jgi:hypothetical protein
MAFSGWSSTAASNGSTLGIDIAENCAAANLNNGLRQAMADLRAAFATALATFFDGSAALPVANGGTGATSAAAALTALGALDDDYRDLPIVAKSASFNLDNTERAKGINYTGAAGTLTIRPNATHAINAGAVFPGRNNGTGAITVSRGAGVSLKKNGSTTSADATVAIGGEYVIKCWGTDDYTISGTGVS